MDAAKLEAIRNALRKEFACDPVKAPCTAGHVHLIYAHDARVIDAAGLLPLTYPDFDAAVDAWVWPTITAYEARTEQKQALPYTTFITARFLWRALPSVTITGLPAEGQPTGPSAADGGVIVVLTGDRPGFTVPPPPRPGAPPALEVTVTVPAETASPAGYPTLRRVCFSTPGAEGSHAELEAGATSVKLAYPAPGGDSLLRLLDVRPHLRIELRPRAPRPARGARPAPPPAPIPIADPWTEKLRGSQEAGSPDVPALAAHNHAEVWEATTNRKFGTITRWEQRRNKVLVRTHHGIVNSGSDTRAQVMGAYASEVAKSRHLVLDAVLGVEGGTNALNTWDGPKLSWGMNQWIGTGELLQIVCYIYDFFPEAFDRCFGRHGIGAHFTARARRWTPTTYANAKLFRVPCCQGPVQATLTAVRADLQRASNHAHIATAARMVPLDTTSYAAVYLFHQAGLDADIQRAQAQWTSFRVTYAMATYHPGQTLTNRQALDDFLKSLGSSVDDATRLAAAQAAIAEARSRGITYPTFDATFDDTGTAESWRSWVKRCEDAGKELPRA